jgi:hypothetical protein
MKTFIDKSIDLKIETDVPVMPFYCYWMNTSTKNCDTSKKIQSKLLHLLIFPIGQDNQALMVVRETV